MESSSSSNSDEETNKRKRPRCYEDMSRTQQWQTRKILKESSSSTSDSSSTEDDSEDVPGDRGGSVLRHGCALSPLRGSNIPPDLAEAGSSNGSQPNPETQQHTVSSEEGVVTERLPLHLSMDSAHAAPTSLPEEQSTFLSSSPLSRSSNGSQPNPETQQHTVSSEEGVVTERLPLHLSMDSAHAAPTSLPEEQSTFLSSSPLSRSSNGSQPNPETQQHTVSSEEGVVTERLPLHLSMDSAHAAPTSLPEEQSTFLSSSPLSSFEDFDEDIPKDFVSDEEVANDDPSDFFDAEECPEAFGDMFQDFADQGNEDELGSSSDDFAEQGTKPLFPGSQVTVLQSMVMLLCLVLSHKLPGTCIDDILKLLAIICGHPPGFISSLYKFKKFFSSMKWPANFHYYCSVCFTSLPSRSSTCTCEHFKLCYFLEFSISAQLQNLYQRKGFFQDLKYKYTRTKRSGSSIEDIYDGDLYKSFSAPGKFLAKENHISFSWYTDGSPVFTSKNFSIWPLFLAINELPYSKRTQRENVILAGLWFSSADPVVNLFLKPFHSQFNDLFKNGVECSVPNVDDPVLVKALLLCGTCDTPARGKFLNMMQFNAEYGCPKCLAKGETLRLGPRSHVHVFPYNEEIITRTMEDYQRDVDRAIETGRPSRGVKSHSELANIMPDMLRGTSVDEMHGLYLGVVRKLLHLWTSSKQHGQPYSLSSLKDVLNSKLLKIKPPSFVQRFPRSLDDLIHWKANELKAWFYYYSLPVLSGVLRAEYFNHYVMLVSAMFILNSESISEDLLQEATFLINCFVSRVEGLYGERYMTINFHQLSHLPLVVKELGPLWVTSCFPFEDLNGKYLDLVHGTRFVGLQIYSSASLFMNLPHLVNSLPLDSAVKLFCDNLLYCGKRVFLNEKLCDNVWSVGKHSLLDNVPRHIEEALVTDNIPFKKIVRFYRLKKGRSLFYSKFYSRILKSVSYCVLYTYRDIQAVGVIEQFIKCTDCDCENCCDCPGHAFALIRKLRIFNPFSAYVDNNVYPLPFLYESEELQEALLAVPVVNIVHLCFYFEVNQKLFVCKPVNFVQSE